MGMAGAGASVDSKMPPKIPAKTEAKTPEIASVPSTTTATGPKVADAKQQLQDPTSTEPTIVIEPPPPPPVYETPALLIADNKLIVTSSRSSKIKSLAYKDGQEFTKGDILVLFYCEDLDYDLQAQQALVRQREAALKNLQDLHKLNSASNFSIVQAETELEQAKKLIEKLEYQIENLCVIKAEYTGKVIHTQVTDEEFVVPGQEIMTTNNNKELLVKAYIPVVWLDWLKLGNNFELCLSDNSCLKGIVNRVGAEVDATSQTIDVFGKLTSGNKDNLIAGISGQLIFDKS